MTEVDDVARRLSILENWRRELDVSRAREDENRKHMDARFDAIESGLGEIRGGFKRIGWIIGSIVLTALATFVINGGLLHPLIP